MNPLYRILGFSKQAYHKRLNRYLQKQEELHQMLPLIKQLREDHPAMAAKEMYRLLLPNCVGRDKFEEFCFSNGLKVLRKRAYHKTTDSTGVTRFPNLILSREFTRVNQAWVSDITYYRIGEKFYYLTFIMDLFSRYIVGYSVSKSLRTECTTIPALQMALSHRKPPKGLIFHSDGGGQYYSKSFLTLTSGIIDNSMCESVYENPHAERINGTIKNGYLIYYGPSDFNHLRRLTTKAIYMYNNQKGHKALQHLSPARFEQKTKASDANQITKENLTIVIGELNKSKTVNPI